MKASKAKILPCPFCSGAAVLECGPFGGWFQIHCVRTARCGTGMGARSTERSAIAAWNRRSK